MFKMRLYIVIAAFFAVLHLDAQQSQDYLMYIEQYKDAAVEQMEKHGVPASITLAQGILESAAGKSMLAVKANNHFGIKTGGTWNGPYVCKDDDEKQEKFRKYGSVQESYEDHSVFLKKPRYASLFKLEKTDYRGWANGLKMAGYATNPQYANKLINLIETYELWRYDSKDGRTSHHLAQHEEKPRHHVRSHQPKPRQEVKHVVRVAEPSSNVMKRCNGVYYVVAGEGDTYASISEKWKVSEKHLRRYNDVDESYRLTKGDVVFLQKKKMSASETSKSDFHKVLAGESLYSISQKYGIQLKALYKKNRLKRNYMIKVGDFLKIR